MSNGRGRLSLSPLWGPTACTYLLLSSPSRTYSGVAASVFPAVARLADGSLGSNPYALTLALAVTRPSSACRHLLPAGGEKGQAAPTEPRIHRPPEGASGRGIYL